ncbi:hypothetical protein SAMN05421579_10333 [Xenorhabdus japonica]|uniref:Uncharacterized protein n=2 Tax=Xenorhabdus japonica TaxID=53341 RepID=A0A1I4YTD9_9GAMM|nr:hypothetical protein SAMN05421579_10333 [Xenorhabdus japonica]
MYETQEPHDHIFINICHMEDKNIREQIANMGRYNNLSDITADKLREKARIYSELTKIALKKDVKLSD